MESVHALMESSKTVLVFQAVQLDMQILLDLVLNVIQTVFSALEVPQNAQLAQPDIF